MLRVGLLVGLWAFCLVAKMVVLMAAMLVDWWVDSMVGYLAALMAVYWAAKLAVL